MKNLVRGYLAEAKWYHEGYVPSVEEYMAVGELTSGVQALSTSSFVGMGDLVTKEAFDWVFSNPLIVQASSAIGRLMDDVAGHEVRLMTNIYITCSKSDIQIIQYILVCLKQGSPCT